MKMLQSLTVALLASVGRAAQGSPVSPPAGGNPLAGDAGQHDPVLLEFARYGVVFAHSRGLCDNWDPRDRSKEFWAHPVNDLKEMKLLHYLGHGLVHLDRSGNLGKYPPPCTKGSIETGRLDAKTYKILIGLIHHHVGAILTFLNKAAHDPEHEDWWGQLESWVRTFLAQGKAGEKVVCDIESVLDSNMLLKYARYAVLIKLTRGVEVQFKEGPQQSSPEELSVLRDLGNLLCHQVCRPSETMSAQIDGCVHGQIEEHTYNYWMLEIRNSLEDLMAMGSHQNDEDDFQQYFLGLLEFIETLPATLQIKDEYPTLRDFRDHEDNEGYRFNLLEGRTVKYVKPKSTYVHSHTAQDIARQNARKAKKSAGPAKTPECTTGPMFTPNSPDSDESDVPLLGDSPRSPSPMSSGDKKLNSSSPRTSRYSPMSSGDEKLYSSGDEKTKPACAKASSPIIDLSQTIKLDKIKLPK